MPITYFFNREVTIPDTPCAILEGNYKQGYTKIKGALNPTDLVKRLQQGYAKKIPELRSELSSMIKKYSEYLSLNPKLDDKQKLGISSTSSVLENLLNILSDPEFSISPKRPPKK